MTQDSLFYPMFVMAALPGVILVLLFYFRLKAVLDGKVEPHYLENQGVESAPLIVVRLTHNLSNLFEFPVLFFIAGVILISLQKVDDLYISMAWSYVVLRYIHSAIHITYNRVLHRSSVHFLSDVILIAFWVRLLIQLSVDV